MEQTKNVQSFWNTTPNGSLTVSEEIGTPQFFFEYERHRYATEPYILELMELDHVRGKRVLEIGCGMGTDGVQFAKAGADYIGMDLTPNGAGLTNRNLAMRGLAGRAITGDAEHISLPDSSVDLVYSHGVLHHTPNIDNAVREIWRVLKPGGELHIMVYHKRSFNYYGSILFFRRIGALILLFPRGVELVHELTRESISNLRLHRERIRKGGLGYLFGKEWLSRNTDGADNPLSRAYTRQQSKALLLGFTDFRFRVVNLNKRHLPFLGGFLPANIERLLAERVGWHLHIFARKPAAL